MEATGLHEPNGTTTTSASLDRHTTTTAYHTQQPSLSKKIKNPKLKKTKKISKKNDIIPVDSDEKNKISEFRSKNQNVDLMISLTPYRMKTPNLRSISHQPEVSFDRFLTSIHPLEMKESALASDSQHVVPGEVRDIADDVVAWEI